MNNESNDNGINTDDFNHFATNIIKAGAHTKEIGLKNKKLRD